MSLPLFLKNHARSRIVEGDAEMRKDALAYLAADLFAGGAACRDGIWNPCPSNLKPFVVADYAGLRLAESSRAGACAAQRAGGFANDGMVDGIERPGVHQKIVGHRRIAGNFDGSNDENPTTANLDG